MLDIAKLSLAGADADNRISNLTDLAAKLPSNLILIMIESIPSVDSHIYAKTALCKSKNLS